MPLIKNPSFIAALGYNLDCIKLGRLAQMVERLPYTQNVGGSIPSAPTTQYILGGNFKAPN